MSVLNDKWELSQQALEFFVYATLGIVPKEMFNKNKEKYKRFFVDHFEYNSLEFSYENYCAVMCAVQAYLDLARTIEYKDNTDTEKKKFKVTVYNYLAQNCLTEKNTDCLIKDLYEKANGFSIFERDGKRYEFTYGQAQKWVNMTLKYLFLLGIVKSDKKLQIPIDSYILEALWNERNLDIKIPRTEKLDKEGAELYSKEKFKTHREKYCYADEKVKSWSFWDYENNYDPFRKSLPNTINTKWEHEKWIEISEKRKGV